jgi:hypothetical protein
MERLPLLACALLCAVAIACGTIGAVGVGAPDARGVNLDCQLKNPSLLRERPRPLRPSDCAQETPSPAPRPWLWFAAAAVAGAAAPMPLLVAGRRG